MEQIKVLHCIHSLSWGGLEIYTTELIHKLAGTGLQQLVLCSAQGRVAEELRKLDIPLITFPQKNLSKFSQALLIRKLVRQHGITLLHSHSRLDMWACALARWKNKKLKHIYNLYMNATPKRDLFHQWLFNQVDALCSSSETILNEVRKNFPIAQEKLKLIRYGRNIEQFKPCPNEREILRNQYKTKPHQIVFGTLCRIDPGKGVRELVEALDHLDDEDLSKVQLWIIGDPTIIGKDASDKAIYEKASRELFDWLNLKRSEEKFHQHLVYIPFQKNYVPYLEALDVFCLASYNETYSLSVLDAMMMAKPVIGTHAGGTPEQVGNNERGFLAEPHSAESLAEKFRIYLRNPEFINTQGIKAQSWALEHHSWKDTVRAFLNLYLNLNQSS